MNPGWKWGVLTLAVLLVLAAILAGWTWDDGILRY